MRKALVAATVMIAAGLVMAAARPGVLKTKTGNIYDGTIDEKDDGSVLVNVKGIETTIPQDNVQSITYGDFETRWNDQYSKLAKDDVEKRLELSKSALSQRKYDLAEKAAKETLDLDPNNAQAADIIKVIASQRKLDKATPEVGPTGTGPAPTAVKPVAQWKELSNDQINRIRQIELNGDSKVRFSFKNNVVRKYFDANPNVGSTFPEFNKQDNFAKASRIIKDGGDLAKDVEVASDPAAILTFKKDVQPLILRGCATSACHGGNNESTKNFALITPAGDNGSTYTNFFVLQDYSKSLPAKEGDSMFATGKANMIDRAQADSSLLLQYSLPEQSVEQKHPHVRGYNGIMQSKDDPKYKTIQAFISSLNTAPEYGFKFTLERMTPAEPPATTEKVTTGPATKPTTKPKVDDVKNLDHTKKPEELKKPVK